MQMLLELNESLLSVLSKADVVIAAPGHPSQADFPTMVTIMYMLRRGNRMETLTAVKQLTMLCCGAESYVDTATKVVVKATTMKEMRAAGALQTLMTALVRCVALDWSEVEMQICRVISVLVTYEEDWMLLLKNSLEILTALQSLLIKVVRTKHPVSSPRSRSQGFGKSNTCCDVNSLVAAALAKLSLVLCADWGKTAAPSASPHVFVASTRLTEVERAREVLRNSANRHAPKPPLKSQTDPSKTLEIVLTIILTICEGAMVFPPASVLASVTLGDVTQGRGDLTISGAFSRSLPLLSNSSAVLCSIALCNLAECPPCVAVLVQGGALRLLRCWLELGTDLMTGLWDALQKERSSGADSSDSKPISKLLRSKEYVQSFELLTNAAAAVHYLVGGSDIPGDKNLPATDSTAGFIYAQVMAEGLPGALVRLISASVRDFTGAYEGDRTPTTPSMSSEKYPAPTLAGYNIDTDRDNAELLHLMQMLTVPAASAGVGSKDKDKTSSRRPLIHILPRAAEVHLAQALYHLSNRVQSRAHLQAVGAPFALCRLFVSATERTKRKNVRYPAYLGGTSGKGDEPGSGNSAASEKDKKISNKTSFYWDEEDEDDDEFYDRVPLTPQTYSCTDLKGVGVAAGVSTTTGTNNGGGECTDGVGNDYFAKAILQLSLEKSCCQTSLHNPDTRQPKGVIPQPQDEALANHDLMYLKTIVSSCLDALTNFLADDLALKLRCGSHSAADEPGKTVLLGPSFVNFATSPRLSLPEIMGNRCVVEALKISISCLPQGLARLAALRTVGALTDWPLALAGMIEQGITTELVQICQERYTDSTLSHNGQAASIVTPRQAKRGSSFVSFFQGPSPRISGSTSASAGSGSTSERTTANAYNTASSTPNYSTPRNMKMARSISSDSDQGCLDSEYSYSNGRHCSTGGDQSPVNCLISNSIINHSLCDNPLHPTAGVTKKDYTGDSRLGGPSPSALRRPSCGVEAAFSPELMVEETMCICFALANAATYSNECAVQLFNMGLMSVMLRIATSTNLEIVRQALKCVGAMCLVRNSQTSLAVTSDQRHNDTKLKQLRTHTYVRALGALTDALSSPSSLVQLEAVRGIANIAGVDEQMCDQAVAKSLRTIISMLLDSSCDRDTRNAAEDVLKAVGFTGGMRDLEVCQFDVELLGEWFTIKKSMPPQMLARRLVSHWIEDLFNGAQPVPVVINSSTAHSTTPSQVPCPLLSWTSSAPSSASNSRSGSPILGRSQMFWNGPMGNSTSTGGQISSRGFKSEKTLLQTAKTELQRRFSDSISKFVPFCMGGSAARVLREEEEEDQEMREIGLDLFSPSAGSNTSNPYGLYEGMDCPPDGVVNLMDIFYASHLQQVLLMDIVYFLSDPVLESLIAWNESDGYENSVEEINSYDSDYDHDNDVELLRTQQGLRHIGPKGDFDRTSARLSLPIPFSLNALLLPMRCYVTFTRVGRVIERIVEQGGDLQPFSLVFRDSQLSGDTHASLLSTLRRCGRIVTISFANYKSVEIDRDSRMGWLVGNLPPSIRFVRYVLSLLQPVLTLPVLLYILKTSDYYLPPTQLRLTYPFLTHLFIFLHTSLLLSSYRHSSTINLRC